MDCSSPGSSVQGIFQARILEWVAIFFCGGGGWGGTGRDSLPLSHQGSPNGRGTEAQLLHGTWDLPRPGIESLSPALAGGFFLQYIILYISGW